MTYSMPINPLQNPLLDPQSPIPNALNEQNRRDTRITRIANNTLFLQQNEANRERTLFWWKVAEGIAGALAFGCFVAAVTFGVQGILAALR